MKTRILRLSISALVLAITVVSCNNMSHEPEDTNVDGGQATSLKQDSVKAPTPVKVAQLK